MTKKSRPSPYAWMRAVNAHRAPGVNGLIPEAFWRALDEAADELLPSQRRVYELYASGLPAYQIAVVLSWKKRSVWKRLGEAHVHFRRRLASYGVVMSRA